MKDMQHIKNLIIGAGISGLGASIAFRRSGEQSLIIEKDKNPGGLNKSETVFGCGFDYGPKILILDESENSKDILSFLEGNYEKYPINESVYTDKYGFVGFPLQRNLIDIPVNDRELFLKSAVEAQQNPRPVKSYKDWLLNSFGSLLCETILFPYEQKKWQVPLERMDYEWALSRPVKVDLDEMERGSEEKLPPNRWYFYPKYGRIDQLTFAMARESGDIDYSRKVVGVDVDKKIVTCEDNSYHYDNLVSTLPLDELISITKSVDSIPSPEDMRKLGIIIYNLVYAEDTQLPYTAVYFPEKLYIFRRVSLLPNLCPALKKKGFTQVSVEVSVGEKLDTDISAVGQMVEDGVAKIFGLSKRVGSSHRAIEFAYPLQVNELSSAVSAAKRFYQEKNVYVCGRGGNFTYCNSDLAYKQGVDTAKLIIRDDPRVDR